MYESMNPFFFPHPYWGWITEQKKEYFYRTLIAIRWFAFNGTIQNGVNWNSCMNQTRCAKRMKIYTTHAYSPLSCVVAFACWHPRTLDNISEKRDRGWLRLVLGSCGSQQEQEACSSWLLSASGVEKGRWKRGGGRTDRSRAVEKWVSAWVWVDCIWGKNKHYMWSKMTDHLMNNTP